MGIMPTLCPFFSFCPALCPGIMPKFMKPGHNDNPNLNKKKRKINLLAYYFINP
jgi:hypothetical protein